MKLFTTLATVALLWGGVALADDFGSAIQQAYVDAGYTDIVVQKEHGQWIVTATLNGVRKTYLVDKKTGASTEVDPTTIGHDHGHDGANHDVGDDHGQDGAGHDVGDDHGQDGAGHDAGDDHGHDGAGHDSGDDHGGDDHDDSDD